MSWVQTPARQKGSPKGVFPGKKSLYLKLEQIDSVVRNISVSDLTLKTTFKFPVKLSNILPILCIQRVHMQHSALGIPAPVLLHTDVVRTKSSKVRKESYVISLNPRAYMLARNILRYPVSIGFGRGRGGEGWRQAKKWVAVDGTRDLRMRWSKLGV